VRSLDAETLLRTGHFGVYGTLAGHSVLQSINGKSRDDADSSWGVGWQVPSVWNLLLLSEVSGHRLCRPTARSPPQFRLGIRSLCLRSQVPDR